MVDSMARTTVGAWLADAGRRGTKGDSGPATDPLGTWRPGAARRVHTVVGVMESGI